MDTAKTGFAASGPNEQVHPQRRLFTIFRTFLRWTVLGIAVGLIVGAVGTAFHFAIDIVTDLRSSLSWLIWLLPVAGVLIVAIYRFFGLKEDRGTNLCLLAVRDGEPIKLGQAVCIIFGTILTHLCGGSSGREGAALQIGGSIGAFLGRRLKLDEEDARTIVLCGMSACFAALFGTPIAAAIFALEVISVGVLYYSALLPCVLSALTANMIAQAVGVNVMSVSVELPAADVSTITLVALLSIVCAGLSYLFCVVLKQTRRLYKKYLKNEYIRIIVGGLLVAVLTLAIGSQIYSGTGMKTIELAFTEHSGWWMFLLKILLTALTLGAGFKGGEIVPAFFVGATFGSAAADLLSLSPALGAAVGMLAVFCGITNCPVTALVIGIELFGGDGIAFFGVAVAISYLLSGYTGLYSEQKILYSKVKPHYIDRRIGDSRSSLLKEKVVAAVSKNDTDRDTPAK